MKITTLLTAALMPLLATAMPAMKKAQPRQEDSGTFTVMALRSGSPIHFLPMQAAGERFYLGGQPATYCPTEVTNCPPGNQTVLIRGVALDVEVPGGQQIYVNPEGALSFVQAHSVLIPPGSSYGPFSYQPGQPFGQYSFEGWGAQGFMACPNQATNPSSWQVFAALQNATVPTGNVNDCLGFNAAAIPYNGSFAAWQYI
ncbi:hypothetical protein VTN77DRAFT_5379 [Rasamsonia byssochlamydoides]|uniref:uncharacterized protein n=1 Tax=Rasamsonia byssochlamydoides TaxID=89139 RepID=UPI003742DD82